MHEVVTSSREGGSSLNILSGLVAGNFSAYWIGLAIMSLMAIAYLVSGAIPAVDPANLAAGGMMLAPAVFAFGLVAFGFLGMGPVTIAVDSYGPVTDNAQSVYELSTIEQIPNIKADLKKNFGFDVDEWMRTVPLHRVVQIHVAGHEVFNEAGEAIVVDTHGADVCNPVLELLERVLEKTGPVPVLLERDENIPPLEALVADSTA